MNCHRKTYKKKFIFTKGNASRVDNVYVDADVDRYEGVDLDEDPSPTSIPTLSHKRPMLSTMASTKEFILEK